MKIKDKIQKLSKSLFLAVKGKTEKEKQKIVKNFVHCLKRNKKIYLLPLILKEFERYSKQDEVILTLSRKKDREVINNIEQKLKDILGEEKTFKVKIDESIISGFIARTNNYLIDASIKGLLWRVRTQNSKLR